MQVRNRPPRVPASAQPALQERPWPVSPRAATCGPRRSSCAGLHWGSTLYVGQIATSGRSEVTALGDEVNEARASRPAPPVAAHSPPRSSSSASKTTTPLPLRSIPTASSTRRSATSPPRPEGPPRRAGHPRLRRLSRPATSSCRHPQSGDRSASHRASHARGRWFETSQRPLGESSLTRAFCFVGSLRFGTRAVATPTSPVLVLSTIRQPAWHRRCRQMRSWSLCLPRVAHPRTKTLRAGSRVYDPRTGSSHARPLTWRRSQCPP